MTDSIVKFADVKARFQARTRIIKALAHPARLFMLEQLKQKERCVCELTEMVGADISTVSRHLANLRDVGLVQIEKRGTQVFYSLKTPCVLDCIDCVESVLRTTANENLELINS